jgi:hypothetical protein
MIYVPSFIKTGSEIRKLMGGYTDTQTCRKDADRISLLLFFQNMESRLKKMDLDYITLERKSMIA